MNEYKVKVSFKTGNIYTNLLKLIQNDYNSTKLNFEFDTEGIRYLFKLKMPDGTSYVDEIVDNEIILKKGILAQNGNYEFEVSLYGEDNRLTAQVIRSFEVNKELVNTDEVITIDDRVPVLDALINDVNEAIEKVENMQPSSGGTSDYTYLENKPSINAIVLEGNKTLEELGIQPSGNYVNPDDIPTKTSQLTNDSGYLVDFTEVDPTVPSHVKEITEENINNWNNKSDFTGSYDDLTNKPTIPTIPTNISEFTNDSGYLTETEVNELINTQLGIINTELASLTEVNE